MTKLQLLHRALNERLMAAVEQIMEMVGGTVLEYEEETIRVRKENEVLRRRLRWLEGATSADWPGPSEPVMTSIPEDSNPSQQDENTVNCGFEENSGPVVIKTELTDHPLHVRPESADQGSENAGTSTGIAFGLTGSMAWDSAQNYMAPLDFDPSSGISRFRDWRERNRRQRMSFACLDCGKVFGREQGLIFHMRIHSKDRPYMYRQRKACFYGDKRKKRKLHRLSQLTREVGLSREAEDDLSDGSEQTNRSSASPDRLAPGQEDEGLSESDCSSSGKEAKKLPLRRRRPGRTKRTQPCVPCYCPHCPGRVFSGPGQLGMHMKSHRAPQNQGSPTQSSTNKTEEATRTNIPQKQSKSDAGKKNKCAGRKKCPCPRCGKVFFKSSALRLHIKDHENDRPSSQENLDLAVQTEPPKEEAIERKRTAMQNSKRPQKTFSCPVCNKVFTREGWLEPHIRSQHGAVNIKKRKYNKVLVKGKKRRSMRISKQSRQVAIEESKKVTSETQRDTEEVKRETMESQKVLTKAQAITEESKGETEASKVNAKPCQSRKNSSPVVVMSKLNADLIKKVTDDANGPHKDTPGSDGGTSDIQNQTSFTCLYCGESFFQKRKFKHHRMKHIAANLQVLRKRKREARRLEEEQEEKRLKEEKDKVRLNKTSTSNHKTNTTTPQGSPNKDSLPKSRNKSQEQLPCPFCGKIFAYEMRLLVHMQIHSGEKPYPYRQRKKRFYGDVKKGKLQKSYNEEPLGKNWDESGQSVGEEKGKGDPSTNLSSHEAYGDTALEDNPGSLLPQSPIEQPAICNNSDEQNKSELAKDLMGHFTLQPRIVLRPITTGSKYSTLNPGDVKSGHIDHEETSCSVLVDDTLEVGSTDEDSDVMEVEDTPEGGNLCTIPVESTSDGNPEIRCSVSPGNVEVSVLASSQSKVELDNSWGSAAIQESEAKNSVGRQEEDRNRNFPCVIAGENGQSECGKKNCDWTCDCDSIESMKLTVMPEASNLDSLFKETSSGAMQDADSELSCVVISDGEDTDEMPSI
ncbi:uncharacterized protein LOC327500 [Danio rerio]|uniref:Uncharacterized protein LOC327500 n=1 Tax=Danio rerio TaxID=7955 RepID=Q6PFI5_DANRE|nr:uncharacterized protein LOC327500 [Danio rerio]AAH57537.1 Zgc:66474 [Danio rerio]|eukprot:NP_956109.1 uncharacterized protein LOC327500 [Danio rerio]